MGKAGHICSTSKEFSEIFLFAVLSGVRIAESIVLAQHKGHERTGKAWTSMRCAAPFIIAVLAGNRNMFNARQWRIK
jgi:hypothetical protein